MLSGAKHLQYLVENKQMQILRCAQDDSPGTFFAARLEAVSDLQSEVPPILKDNVLRMRH